VTAPGSETPATGEFASAAMPVATPTPAETAAARAVAAEGLDGAPAEDDVDTEGAA
jgi:hypothetical protein